MPNPADMRPGIACIFALLCALPSAARAQQTTPPSTALPPFTASTARQIDAIARSEVHSGSTPALAIGIVEDGLLVYARGFGYAALRPKRRPASAATQFYAASLSKQFTAACVLLLAQQKKLSLDDRLTKYVPELSIARDVTIRELLQQTSGLPDVRKAPGIPHALTDPVKISALLSAGNTLRMQAKPGTAFDDDGFNYMLAGLVVQRVSGLPLSIFEATQIFQPLIMSSTFLAGDEGISPQHAVGYTRARGRFIPVKGWDPSWLFGNADLVTNVQDLAKWDIGFPLLLNVDSVREMWTPNGLPQQLQYGMGWVVDQRGGERYFWQSGRLPGFNAMNAVLPDEHLAVIVLANADSLQTQTTVQPQRLASRILNVVAPLPAAHFANTIVTRASEWLGRLARVDIDRTQLTPTFSQYLTDRLVHRSDFASYGPVLSLVPVESYQRTADTVYVFDVRFRHGNYRFDFTLAPDGKVDGLFLRPGA